MTSMPPPLPPTNPAPSRRSSTWRPAEIAFVVIGISVGLLALLIPATSPDPEVPKSPAQFTSFTPDETEQRFNDTIARVNVWAAVKSRLKSPSTADFGWVAFEPAGDDRWETRSHVDSQNSFGATVRTEFVATVDRQGNLLALEMHE